MIGNDIVDLNLARQQSNWRRRGYLDKLFTHSEQELIRSATDPDLMIWTLWSMKESAYKLIVRETSEPFFAPEKLVCQLVKIHSGTIEGSVFYQKSYPAWSIITTSYVASLAFLPDSGLRADHEIVTFDRTDYQYQHTRIREKIKQHYATCFSVPESSIQIQKNEKDVPMLMITDFSGAIIRQQAISLSHHGQYGAFAMA
ncbi:4'-phosphopantetheinyl transferase family protein [Spirosoma sp.]|uniref:4'-phosphopantetheinyl transferase family protein n=1 Tax=Spirosoma sp. TaxID=1899569 RepID=UPI003B3AE6A4